ncbi:hypothetical protein [Vibrio cionasavignyae]|uniref:hypothetical protein n=1 Tax=Vibrio cionasavignyae TaxID=2910252 RepID=UPI003D0FFBD1
MKKLFLSALAALVLVGCAGAPKYGQNIMVVEHNATMLANCKVLGHVSVDARSSWQDSDGELRDKARFAIRDAVALEFPSANVTAINDRTENRFFSGRFEVMAIAYQCY